MTTGFKKAQKYESKLRLALEGPSGSGKTMTALILGTALARHTESRLALIDTEKGSASKYADQFDFDVMELSSFHPSKYIEAIKSAEQAGYKVLIIDSLSHEWNGPDGTLETVSSITAKSPSKNAYTTGWREMTPLHNKLIDTMMGSKMHVIATMRSKTAYILEDEQGKRVPKKVGMEPIQKEGMDYEFDVVGEFDRSLNLSITKTRCPALHDQVIPRPTGALAETLIQWLQGVALPAVPTVDTQTGEVLPPSASPTTKAPRCSTHKVDFKWVKGRAGGYGWAHTVQGQKPCIYQPPPLHGQEPVPFATAPTMPLASEETLKRLNNLRKSKGWAVEDVVAGSQKQFGKEIEELSENEAEKLIAWIGYGPTMPAEAIENGETGFEPEGAETFPSDNPPAIEDGPSGEGLDGVQEPISVPETMEELRNIIIANHGDWQSFQIATLGMSWTEWQRRHGKDAVMKAWELWRGRKE